MGFSDGKKPEKETSDKTVSAETTEEITSTTETTTEKEENRLGLVQNGEKHGSILKILAMAKADRENGCQTMILNMKKNKKFQIEQLEAEGYSEIVQCYRDSIANL